MLGASNSLPPKVLVVGGDSLIGSSLVEHFRSQGTSVIYTSRRPYHESPACIPLELGKAIALPYIPEVAILCAGVTDFRSCAEQPDATRRINVDAVLGLAATLQLGGARILYLSSNAVCEIEKDSVQSHSLPPITTELGAQKYDTERGILALGERATVVRATKVVSCRVPMFEDWLTCLGQQLKIFPWSDKYLCPISMRFIVFWLAELALRNVSGVFHLSGENLVSYSEFGLQLAASMSADFKLVVPSTMDDAGLTNGRPPQHACLDMKLTTSTLGATPQTVDSVLSDLLEEFYLTHAIGCNDPSVGSL